MRELRGRCLDGSLYFEFHNLRSTVRPLGVLAGCGGIRSDRQCGQTQRRPSEGLLFFGNGQRANKEVAKRTCQASQVGGLEKKLVGSRSSGLLFFLHFADLLFVFWFLCSGLVGLMA